MYSDSADAWMSPEVTSQGSAKRTLYTMLKHMGLPTDIVTGKKTGFLRCHLYIKCIILPRQARDKHRENSKKDRFVAEDDCTKGHLNHYGVRKYILLLLACAIFS
jgi:hypothetical protein